MPTYEIRNERNDQRELISRFAARREFGVFGFNPADAVPPIYRAIDLGPTATDGIGVSMMQLGINELCAIAGTRATTDASGGTSFSGWVWLPPSLRPPVGAGFAQPDAFKCYPLPTPSGAANAWASDINEFGVVVGASGSAFGINCDATAWTTGYFAGLVASERAAVSDDWSVFTRASNGLGAIAVGAKSLDCIEDVHPLAYDIGTDSELSVAMPSLPFNAPITNNHIVDVLDVHRWMTAIDSSANYWTAQCSTGNRISNCTGSLIVINAPKLDTAGFSAQRPNALTEVQSIPSPLDPRLFEATWASSVNGFGQVCGAIDEWQFGSNDTEHWQPAIWNLMSLAGSALYEVLPTPPTETGGRVLALDAVPSTIRRACGFLRAPGKRFLIQHPPGVCITSLMSPCHAIVMEMDHHWMSRTIAPIQGKSLPSAAEARSSSPTTATSMVISVWTPRTSVSL